MLKYQFPAVRGCQAGKDYYICMVPLGLMSKIFVTDSGDVPAEYRAQRKLNRGAYSRNLWIYIIQSRFVCVLCVSCLCGRRYEVYPC